MRVLLVDADSVNGFPNLALMKYSAYHKGRGDHIDLIRGIPSTKPLFLYDLIIISCIFFQNKQRVLDYADQFTDTEVLVGGSGVDLALTLPDEIEHILPDYYLYGLDFSMGFTSRGCLRNCEFCAVPTKEGPIRDHAPISEFHNIDFKKLMLLDNNFLASPRWRENLREIKRLGVKVNFNQGLDIRLMTEEIANLLVELKVNDWHFRKRALHFAFDDPRFEKYVRDGVALLVDAGFTPSSLMFYVLVGFNTTKEQDIERVRILKELGVKPFIMPYNQSTDPWIRHFARYINGRWHEFIEFKDYNEGVLVE